MLARTTLEGEGLKTRSANRTDPKQAIELARADAAEAREQQRATSEILKVIASSPSDAQPVFEAIIRSASRLSGGCSVNVSRLVGDRLHLAAYTPVSPEADEILRSAYPVDVKEVARPLAEVVRRRQTFFVSDFETDPDVGTKARELMRARGFRSTLYVPIMRGEVVHGVMHVSKVAPGPFAPELIRLLETFADQAVIAIENVRLFNETNEALERQTATAEILRVISSSPTDVQPVFDAIVRATAKLCNGRLGTLLRFDGEFLHLAAHHNVGAEGLEAYRRVYPRRVSRETVAGCAILDRAVINLPDAQDEGSVPPHSRAMAAAAGFRSVLVVPMMRDGQPIGIINVARAEPGPFSETHIDLLRTFADQAVIAIENVRLFNETKEALEHERAIAEILQAISSTPGDTGPVMRSVVAKAAQLADADHALIGQAEGSAIRWLAAHGCPLPEGLAPITPELPSGRAMLEGRTTQVEDVARSEIKFPRVAKVYRELGVRTIIATPLVREGKSIGVLVLRRTAVRPFTEKQVALLKTFANQAAIAIENVRLFNETKEALEQQTAISDVLRVISDSPTDVKPVMEAVAARAARICGATEARIFLRHEDTLRHAAGFGDVVPVEVFPLDAGSASGRAVITGAAVHIHDVAALSDGEYPVSKRRAAQAGWRTILAVPLMREQRALGTIALFRREVQPFTEKHISLLGTFANQAAIAIENVRLFNETREALERQTATSEVLKVISRTRFDLQPVLDIVLENARRLCDADRVLILRPDADGQFLPAAARISNKASDNVDALTKRPIRPDRSTAAGRALLERRPVHIPDALADPEYGRMDLVEAGGWRTALAVPMLREGVPIGALTLTRAGEPRPFTDKQIELVSTFADQAVIAIENVRLFNETKEALERQTATSEVLKVISQARIDLEPVLDIVLKNARRLCGADQAVIFQADDEGNCVPAALQVSHSASEIMQFYREHPIRPDRGSATGRAMLERRAIHIADVLADPDYRMEYAANRNYRSILAVPMLREGSPIGVLTVTRIGEPKPFTDKQIELVTSFADQAVIAVENVRLFNETTEALEQQKALAEVLRVISSSVADTQPVFEAILESCQRLFEGHIAGITTVGEDGAIHLAAYQGPKHEEFARHFPVPATSDSGSGAAIQQACVVHYPDMEAPGVPEYARRGSSFTGTKSCILAPMLWKDQGIGAIFVGRQSKGPFSEKDIALLKTFADQAVIAVQNARLFREIHEKSRQLEVANRHKSEFLANMSHELRTPLNAIIGFTRIVMRRAKDQLDPKQYENLEKIHASGQHLLNLINAILDLSKVEAGRVEVIPAELALGPVLEQCVKTVEPLIKAPAVRLLKEFDGELPQVYLDEEKLRQIVINLLSNAAKFTERGSVCVQAKCNGDSFSVAVADTGIGIPGDKLEHVFEEFAQADASSTRVYGGTGLGLTIARRLARLMGGDIAVRSAPGVGSTFTLSLPVRYAGESHVQVKTEAA